MTDLSLIWNEVFIRPILNILLAFYKGFSLAAIPWSFGFAIIALTVFVRFLLYPLTVAQLKSAKKMVDLKPHLEELKNKHGHDKQRLAREQMELYKRHGINPAAGCLPLILQMPIFISLYQVFWNLLGQGDLTKLVEQANQIVYWPFLKLTSPPDLYFFGFNLAAKPSQWQSFGVFLLLIPVVTAALMFVQSLMMLPASAPSTTLGASARQAPKKPEGKSKGGGEEMAQILQKQMTYFMPVMIGFFAFSFPVGLSLYWNTFTLFGIIQQAFVSGWGSLARWKIKI